MPDQSIRGFIASLQQAGEILRFVKEVDPDENLSAIGYQAFARLGKSSLFESLKGHPGWRVASQIVADRRKWAIALGVPEDEVVAVLGERIAKPIDPVMVQAKDAPVKQVIKIGKDVDLGDIPAMWTSEADPGRYIAAGMCVIKDPHTGIRNVSFHRAQVIGPNTTGFLICPRQALKIYQMYGELNRPMEAAMVIGAHPSLVFSSGYVAPYGRDELSIAGGLLGEPIRLVKCETVDLEVPADAEIVLEGELLPSEMTPEGPFGEVTGGYAQEGSTPLFRIKAITRRKDPIFYAMQCGLPPSDAHSIVCTTIEMRLWQHLKKVAGGLDLLDVRCIAGMTPMMVVLKVRQKMPGQARAAALAALSSPYLHPKIAVVVDDDVDIQSMREVYWALSHRVREREDLQKIDGARVFALDNASPIEPGMSAMYRVGTKVLIDATEDPALPRAKWAKPGSGDYSPEKARKIEQEVADHIRQIEGGLDILQVRCLPKNNRVVIVKMRPRVEGQSKTAAMGALSSPAIEPRLVVVIDDDVDVDTLTDVSWSFATRVHAQIDVAAIDGLPSPEGPCFKWFVDLTKPPLTQPVNRADFERARPKNMDSVKLDDFLPD